MPCFHLQAHKYFHVPPVKVVRVSGDDFAKLVLVMFLCPSAKFLVVQLFRGNLVINPVFVDRLQNHRAYNINPYTLAWIGSVQYVVNAPANFLVVLQYNVFVVVLFNEDLVQFLFQPQW